MENVLQNNITAEEARANYQVYQEKLNSLVTDYLSKWCNEIEKASKNGGKYIYTNCFLLDNKDNIYMMIDDSNCAIDFPDISIKYYIDYFKSNGFEITLETSTLCIIEKIISNKKYLKISWME